MHIRQLLRLRNLLSLVKRYSQEGRIRVRTTVPQKWLKSVSRLLRNSYPRKRDKINADTSLIIGRYEMNQMRFLFRRIRVLYRIFGMPFGAENRGQTQRVHIFLIFRIYFPVTCKTPYHRTIVKGNAQFQIFSRKRPRNHPLDTWGNTCLYDYSASHMHTFLRV